MTSAHTRPEPRRIADSTFVIVTNGHRDGPAHALREYLLRRHAQSVTLVVHPLAPGEPSRHIVTTQTDRGSTSRSYWLPKLVPYTYALDPLVPPRPPRATAWFGFNCLAALRGLVAKRIGKADSVYYWAVDFVPTPRFGRSPVTTAYNAADRVASRRSDARIELSQAALEGRNASLGLGVEASPAVTIPMGAWIDRVTTTTPESWDSQRIVYLGHLLQKQGVAFLIEAMSILAKRLSGVTLEIIGDGPDAAEFRNLASSLELNEIVTFCGQIESHEEVERMLADGTIGAAPYVESADSYTRFADPGKLKAYLAAGLPIVVTDVPPNARELEAAGAAIVSGGSPESLADSFERYLSDRDLWLASRQKALERARLFDWGSLLHDGLGTLGWE